MVCDVPRPLSTYVFLWEFGAGAPHPILRHRSPTSTSAGQPLWLGQSLVRMRSSTTIRQRFSRQPLGAPEDTHLTPQPWSPQFAAALPAVPESADARALPDSPLEVVLPLSCVHCAPSPLAVTLASPLCLPRSHPAGRCMPCFTHRTLLLTLLGGFVSFPSKL